MHLDLIFPIFIGYGNIAPSTEGGKIFCILYAIFGIPLFGFLLAGVGDQLGTIFVKSIAKVEIMFRVSYMYIWYIKSLQTHVQTSSFTEIKKETKTNNFKTFSTIIVTKNPYKKIYICDTE